MRSSLVAMWFYCCWLQKGQGKGSLKRGINRQAHRSTQGESAHQWCPHLFPPRSHYRPHQHEISTSSSSTPSTMYTMLLHFHQQIQIQTHTHTQRHTRAHTHTHRLFMCLNLLGSPLYFCVCVKILYPQITASLGCYLSFHGGHYWQEVYLVPEHST